VVQLWDAVLNAGCAGGCAFMWVDGWWKAGDEHTHTTMPRMVRAPGSRQRISRPAPPVLLRHAGIQPRHPDAAARRRAFAGPFSIEVWAPEAAAVQYRIDDGPWLSLKRDGPWWWRGAADARELAPGDHYFWTRALGADGCPAGVKQAVITADQKPARREMPLTVEILNLPARASDNEPLRIEVMVRDAGGQAVSGQTGASRAVCAHALGRSRF
jgi:hypothetical protein